MKSCTISYEKDKHFLSHEFTDAISNEAFCEGDVVVVCECCNSIMHEHSWLNNGNLCGACEGTVLKDISHKYLKSYKPNSKKSNINSDRTDESVDAVSKHTETSNKKRKKINFKHARLFLMLLLVAAVILGISYVVANHQTSEDIPTTIQTEQATFEETTLLVINELSISQTDKKEIAIDDAFVGDDIWVDEESPVCYSGYISEDNETNEYSFTAPRSGRYNFSVEDIMATASVKLTVYDEFDSSIIDTYSNSYYAELTGQKTYRIVIGHDSGESSFNLVIGIQKKTVDISNSSTIYDQITFENQKNKYSFTAPISGRYRFDITESNANDSFRLMMWDDKDKNIIDTYDNGFYIVLDAGKTYEIQIRQDSGIGEYCLKVGFQKATTDVTGYTSVIDSIEYTDQKNVYKFTANISGRYRLDITETNANNSYRLMVWDHLDKSIADTYDSGADLNLTKGEVYEIQIRYDSGYGGYKFNIGYQKEKKDITNIDVVHDSIEFDNQINVYKYIPEETREYSFELIDYNADCSFELIVLDEYENVLTDTYNESVSVNLETGREYTIKICQDSEYSDYTLNIK